MDKREEGRLKCLIMKIKMLIITKLRRRVFSSASPKDGVDDIGGGETGGGATMVPNDVKEGHFAVVAAVKGGGGEPKRFVLELGYLSNPKFLELLELAEEEFGFQQKGVLVIPCPPEELQNVLIKHY